MLVITFFALLLMSVSINSQAAKKYTSYKKVISSVKNGPIDSSRCYYNYTKLKSSKGTKKMLVITKIAGVAAFYTTDIYLHKGNKVMKVYSADGLILSYSKDKKYILIYDFFGSGCGYYAIYKYNSKKGKYIRKTKESFDRLSTSGDDDRALQKVEKKAGVDTSKFITFERCKYKIYDTADLYK